MNHLVTLIIFYLSVFGITNIIVRESIFRWLHAFIKSRSKFISELINCPTCLSFWIGSGLTLMIPEIITIDINIFYKLIIMGSSCSFLMKIITIKLFTF